MKVVATHRMDQRGTPKSCIDKHSYKPYFMFSILLNIQGWGCLSEQKSVQVLLHFLESSTSKHGTGYFEHTSKQTTISCPNEHLGRRDRRKRADFLIPQMKLSHERIISFELRPALPHKSCSYCSTNLLPMRQTCQHHRAGRLKIYLKVPRSTSKCLQELQSTMKYHNLTKN